MSTARTDAHAQATVLDHAAYRLSLAGIYLLVGVLFFYSGKSKLFDEHGHAPAAVKRQFTGTFVSTFPGIDALQESAVEASSPDFDGSGRTSPDFVGNRHARYLTSVSILNIGRYIEMITMPTITPTPSIMIGSTIEVRAPTDASTSSS